MSEQEFNRLVEASWRRPLGEEEEAKLLGYLAAHPADQARWDEELALSTILRSTPAVPVSSNFTALVMNAVEQESKERLSSLSVGWRPLGWLSRLGRVRVPQLAWAAVFLVMGVSGVFLHQAQQEQKIATGIARFAEAAATIPAPQNLQDFDVIRELTPAAPSGDGELLAVLSTNP